MKWLIYGHNGWIGKQVLSILYSQNETVITSNVRADNEADVLDELTNVHPDRVICLIGRTHGPISGNNSNSMINSTIDYLEQKGKLTENLRDNLFAPVFLSIICSKLGIHVTYLGTGCIFEYDNEHKINTDDGFTESSPPNFFGSSYSVAKGYTDRLMHLFDDTTLNVRIRMPITADNSGRNFITKITTYAKICSVPNSMTVLPELLPLMIDMAKNRQTGTINLTNPGVITHNEILEMYREIVNPEFTWENFSIDEQDKILAAGRSNNLLDTSKLKLLYPQLNDIKTAVRNTLMAYKNANSNSSQNIVTQI